MNQFAIIALMIPRALKHVIIIYDNKDYIPILEFIDSNFLSFFTTN